MCVRNSNARFIIFITLRNIYNVVIQKVVFNYVHISIIIILHLLVNN